MDHSKWNFYVIFVEALGHIPEPFTWIITCCSGSSVSYFGSFNWIITSGSSWVIFLAQLIGPQLLQALCHIFGPFKWITASGISVSYFLSKKRWKLWVIFLSHLLGSWQAVVEALCHIFGPINWIMAKKISVSYCLIQNKWKLCVIFLRHLIESWQVEGLCHIFGLLVGS